MLAALRLGKIDTPFRELWNAQTCPEELLPYLAWGLSVDQWSADWPLYIRRARVASAIEIQRRKGTPKSVVDVINSFGGSGNTIPLPRAPRAKAPGTTRPPKAAPRPASPRPATPPTAKARRPHPALHHAGRPARINSRHHAKAQNIAGKVFRIGSGRHGQTMARDRSGYAGVYRVGWLAKCWQPGKGRPSLGLSGRSGCAASANTGHSTRLALPEQRTAIGPPA
jgi:hypothetical protein